MIYAWISLALLIIIFGVIILKGTVRGKLPRIALCLGIFVSYLLYTLFIVSHYFTGQGITIDVLYFLLVGLEGAGFLEYIQLIMLSLLAMCFTICICLVTYLRSSFMSKYYAYGIYTLLIISILSNPALIGVYSVFDEDSTESDFDLFFRNPDIEQIGEAKNLVLIYGEGLERTYFNESLFPQLVPELNKFASQSTSFTNIFGTPYASHTMAGMVASQCGFPLVIRKSLITLAGMDEYLRGATCLGDLLDEQGYYLSYYGGAHLAFARKGQFYSSHRFSDVNGQQELLKMLDNRSYRSGWGLYDDSLLDFAFNGFIELSQTHEKFAQVVLTLDTHHPKGIPSKSCDTIVYGDGEHAILNAVSCSSKLISEFISRIRSSDYSQDTVIVLVSDHLAHTNSVEDILNSVERRNLFLINTHNGVPDTVDTPGFTYDISSTLLPFIGYKAEIGFGRDLMLQDDDLDRINNLKGNMSALKPQLAQFWDFPILTSLYIPKTGNRVEIDNRSFTSPVFIEFDENLQTILNFEYYYRPNLELSDFIEDVKSSSYFVWIDTCEDIDAVVLAPINSTGKCVIFGTKDTFGQLEQVQTDLFYSQSDIEYMIQTLKTYE